MLGELVRWGAPLMVEGAGGDVVRGHWLAGGMELYLGDNAPDGPTTTIELRSGEEVGFIETVDGVVRSHLGAAQHPEVVVEGAPELILGVISGLLELAEAQRRGLQFQGDPGALQRVIPRDAKAA